METLTNWTARRSSDAITILATGADGKARKVTNVESITTEGGRIVATTKAPRLQYALDAGETFIPQSRNSIPQSHHVEGRNFVD